jgi:hypothetical protein
LDGPLIRIYIFCWSEIHIETRGPKVSERVFLYVERLFFNQSLWRFFSLCSVWKSLYFIYLYIFFIALTVLKIEQILCSFYCFQDMTNTQNIEICISSLILIGFFSLDSLWNFLPALVNKIWPRSYCSEIKGVKDGQMGWTPKIMTLFLCLVCVLFFH